MTQRKKLIKLLKEALENHVCGDCESFTECEAHCQADYLLANGVVVLPCKVGEKFYLVYESGTVEERECCGFSIFNGEIEIIDEVDSRYRDNENEYYKLFFSREAAEAASKKMETELKPCPFCGGKACITQTLSQTETAMGKEV